MEKNGSGKTSNGKLHSGLHSILHHSYVYSLTGEDQVTVPRAVLWQRLDAPGLDFLRIGMDEKGIAADGIVITLDGPRPLTVRYSLLGDVHWQLEEVTLELRWQRGRDGLLMQRESDGIWRVNSEERRDLADCIDIDISLTPFTNTLPIRRLRLAPDEGAEVSVVFIKVPELKCAAVRQRYTRLEDSEEGWQRYMYESLSTGYSTTLLVDDGGLVVEYPGCYRQIASQGRMHI